MMRTSKYVVLLGLFACLMFTGQVFATDRHVNGQLDGPGLGLYITIQDAVDDCVPGDVIHVYDDLNTPPVPGADPGLASYDGAVTVTVDDITFIGVGSPVIADVSKGSLTAFTINGRDGLVFENLAINDYMTGMLGWGVTNLTVTDVTMNANTTGYYLNVSDGDFDNLAVSNCDVGFRILTNATYTAASGNMMTGCTFDGNTSTSLMVGGGGGNPVDGNTFTGLTFTGNAYGPKFGLCTNLDFNGNEITGSTNDGILVYDEVSGAIYDNNVQFNDIGINVTFDMSTGQLRIYSNCLGNNTTYAAKDVNDLTTPFPVVWYSTGQVGNFYPDYVPPGYYYIAGAGGNYDKYPLTATNTPTGPPEVALGEEFDVDFVFEMAADCAPFQRLKTCQFVITWDANLLDLNGTPTAGDYLPSPEMLTTSAPGMLEVHLSALGEGNYATEYSGNLVTVHFVAASDAVGTDAISVSSEYIDKDNNNIPTTSPAYAYEVADVTDPVIAAELVDSPTDDDTYGGDFPLTMDWTVTDDFDLQYFHYRIVDDAGVQVEGWKPVTLPYPDGTGPVTGQFTLDLTDVNLFGNGVTVHPDGDYYLILWLRDAAANEDLWDYPTKGTALMFTVDNTPPAPPAFNITDSDCADDGYTNNLLVNIEILDDYEGNPTDKGKLQWAYAGDWRAIIDFTYNFQVTMDDLGSPYTHTLYLQIADVYGNWSHPSWTNDAIAYKTDAPDETMANFRVLPNRTKSLTPNARVDNWGDHGSTEYALSVDTDVNGAGVDLTCDDATWVAKFFEDPPDPPTPVTFPVTLPDGPDGDYEVCMVIRDAAGNLSAEMCDVVELDRTPPEFSAFAVSPDNGQPCDNNWTFNVDMTFTEDPAQVKIYVEGGTGTYSYVAVTGNPMTYSFTIDPADQTPWYGGDYTIRAKVKDALGNVCTVDPSAVISIDRKNPVPGAVYVNGFTGPSWGWSNSDVAVVTLPDASDDITHVRLCEGSACDITVEGWQDFDGTDPAATAELTLTGCCYPAPWSYVKIQTKDCAGRTADTYGWAKWDNTAPVVAAAIKNGAEKTKNLTNTVNLTVTEAFPQWVMVSEDETFTDPAKGDVLPPTRAYTATPQHTFTTTDDGIKILYVRVYDQAGNFGEAQDDIYLDRTKPGGTFTIVAPGPSKGAGCPGALPGYTCDRYDNVLVFSGVSADVKQIQIQNCNGNSNTGWIAFDPATTEYVWPFLDQGVAEGFKCVGVLFKDSANNVTADWITNTIYYDPNPPTWASVGSPTIHATPSEGDGKDEPDVYAHAIDLSFTAHPQAQGYGINWQHTTDYPYYVIPFPGFPPTILDEFFGPRDIAGSPYTFTTIEVPGIYFMSLFAQDSAGNWSTDKLTIATQNYFGGDFGLLGGLRIDDFNALANHYFSPVPIDVYDDAHDIGPTNTGWIDGYTLKDGAINFEDLVIFTFNFDAHPLAGKGSGFPTHGGPISAKPLSGLVVSAEVPSSFRPSEEFTAVIRVNEAAPIKCMSLTLDYDTDLLEVVSIEPGSMFENSSAFLLNCVQGSSIRLDATILGADAQFESSEIALIHFQSKSNGSFQFAEPIMDVRDRNNEVIEVAFSNALVAPAAALPTAFTLAQNYPNPFNPTTNIDLSLPAASEWRIDIYNIAGQVVKTFSGYDEPGKVSVVWDGTDAYGSSVASGIYFYRATADGGRFMQTRKMVLMK